MLKGLDEELAENGRELGQDLTWSTADQAVRDMIADTIDRKQGLQQRAAKTNDDKMALEFSKELRLLETSLARLLKAVKTDLPPAPSKTSQKAGRAARSRWDRENA